MYYILSNHPYKKKVDFIINGAIFDERGDFVPNIFNAGNSLMGNAFTIRPNQERSKPGKLRDKLWVEVNGASELFVVSPKVVNLFQNLGISNVELIDFSIQGSGYDISDYKLVNFLGKVDCADDRNSEFGYFTDTFNIYSIEQLALDESKIPSHLSIFLLDRTDNLVVVVKEELMKEIQENDLTGFVFVQPENFAIG